MSASVGGRSGRIQTAAARSASRALIACSSRSQTTATKLPSRTTVTTPGIALTAPASRLTSSARGAGGRTTRACSMPGRRRSWTYAAPPVNFGGMSRRERLWPTYLYSPGAFGFAFAVASRRSIASEVTSQYVACFPPGAAIVPSATFRSAGATPELRRGGAEQELARLGAREANRGAALLDRLAAGGHALVGRPGRVAGHHLDPAVVDVELVGGDLGERGRDALAELDLAGEHRHRPVRVDAQPRRQHAVAVEASRAAVRASPPGRAPSRARARSRRRAPSRT